MLKKKQSFPLPKDYFTCPPLTTEATREYIRQGQQALIDLVQKSQLRLGPIDWKFDHEVNGVRVYRGVDHTTGPTPSVIYLNMTEIQATLDESANLMSAGADGTRDYCATYLDNILDVQALYTIATPTPEHPHSAATIKWRVLSSKSALVKNRDMVVMEYQDDFSVNGVRGFARCVRSVDVGAVCPDLLDSLNLVRAHIYLDGDLFLESNRPGYVTVCRIYQSDMKGSVPAWLVSYFSKRRVAKCIAKIDSHFRHDRLARQSVMQFLPDHRLVPMSERQHCATCFSKFTPLLRKTHCRVCGEVYCKKCNPIWDVHRQTLTNTKTARICLGCTSATTARSPTSRSTASYASVASCVSLDSDSDRLGSNRSSSSPRIKVDTAGLDLEVYIGGGGFNPDPEAALWKDLDQADSPASMLGLLRQMQALKSSRHATEHTPEKRVLLDTYGV